MLSDVAVCYIYLYLGCMYQCWMLKGAKILYDRLTLTSLIPILWKIEKN